MQALIRFIRERHERIAPLFEKGSKLEKLHPLWEAHDTIMFTPGTVTADASHVRDGIDLKRMMITVVIALIPCMLTCMVNTGYQIALALANGAAPLDNWQSHVFYGTLGLKGVDNLLTYLLHGALYFLPIYIVTLAAGGAIEVIFAIVRKHDINEGFLVTSALLPLTLPATIPLWQVALGIMFGVFFGKEIFGGTGMNFLNPALTARAFLFFAYPAQISGDKVWIAAQTSADGYSGATLLARAAEGGTHALEASGFTWLDAFLGSIPGSMGETSTLACLVGAAVLIVTGVASWRTMAGCLIGSFLMVGLLNQAGSSTNPFFEVPVHWHWVLGGFAFAAVFMATDPVSSAFTNTGRWIYGTFIGVFGILIRVINPAYPEGWMLAILFMNMFAPFIDYFVKRANIKRRIARSTAESAL